MNWKIASTFREQLALTEVPCIYVDPDTFFGDDEDEDEKYGTTTALDSAAVCRICPLRVECLADAIRTNDQYGVRGGMTPSQRESLRGRI